jgi:hypothetical protein
MYQANVLSIMIVSPSDVVQEREIVKQTIFEWNAIHSEKKIYDCKINYDIIISLINWGGVVWKKI